MKSRKLQDNKVKPSFESIGPAVRSRFRARILILLGIGIAALVTAFVVRQRVGENYRKSRILQREYDEQQAAITKLEAAAATEEAQLRRLRDASAANPNDVKARWALADKLQHLHLLKDAKIQIEQIVKLDPKSELAAVALGNIRMASGDPTGAEKAYLNAADKWPKNAEAWQGIAATRFQLKRFREAAGAAHQAMLLDPTDDGARYLFASAAIEYGTMHATTQIEQAPVGQARIELEKMVKKDPENGPAIYKLALACNYLRDKPFAVKYYKRAYELLPQSVNVAVGLVQAHNTAGDRKEALHVATEAILRFPKAATLYHLKSDLIQAIGEPKDLPEAVSASKKAVELNPGVPVFYDKLGSAYLRMGNLQEARDAFEGSLKTDKNRAFPYQQLAAIYSRLGDIPRSNTAAKFATRMVHNDQLLRQIEELSQQYPEDIKLLSMRAGRYADLNMRSAAIEMYQQIIALDSKNDDAKLKLQRLQQHKPPAPLGSRP